MDAGLREGLLYQKGGELEYRANSKEGNGASKFLHQLIDLSMSENHHCRNKRAYIKCDDDPYGRACRNLVRDQKSSGAQHGTNQGANETCVRSVGSHDQTRKIGVNDDEPEQKSLGLVNQSNHREPLVSFHCLPFQTLALRRFDH